MHPSSDTRFNDGHLVTYFEPYCLEGFIVFCLHCCTRGFSFLGLQVINSLTASVFNCVTGEGLVKKHKTTPND